MKKPGILLGPLIEVSMFEIIRSFVNRGIEVIVFDNESSAPGFYMRGISEKKIAPDPVTRHKDFVTFLLQLGKEYPGYVLLINDDLYHRIISEHVEELKKILLILVSEGPINAIASDKAETVAAALKCGVPVPETYNIVDNFDNVNTHFPLLIKPRIGSRGQYLIKSPEELAGTLRIINKYRENYIAYNVDLI